MIYAGVGSRKTPENILTIMIEIGRRMAEKGNILRSGGAYEADTAFELGCVRAKGKKEIFYANDWSYDAMNIASSLHPNWKACTFYAKQLHAKNAFQILGRDLKTPCDYMICWTPDGCKTHKERSIRTGGTGTAISIADKYGVKVYNLKRPDDLIFIQGVITCL